MTHKDLEDFANALIQKHLAGSPWKFKWNERVTAWGMCDESDWSISVSKRTFNALIDKEDAKETVRHEVAHAIVGCHHGHDAVWKAKAFQLGVRNPTSCSNYLTDKRAMGYTYAMVSIVGYVVRAHGYYVRKPRKSLVGSFITKDAERTKGKVYHCSTEDLWAYDAGKLTEKELRSKSWQ